MKDPFLYLIESIICSSLFLAIYRLCIMRATGYGINRIFLLLAMIGACTIPLCQIPIWSAKELIITLPTLKDVQGETSGMEQATTLTWNHWLMGIYVLGIVMMLIRMFIPIFRALRLKHTEKVIVRGAYSLVVSQEVQNAFSSLRTIYLPIFDNKEEERLVLAHEESHLRHFHIAERWLLELLKAIYWFNPFVWIASRYLIEVQEMEADSDVLHQGFDMTEYRKMLLKHTMGREEWICSFSPAFMKKRLMAMTEQRKIQNFRIWLMLPMLALGLVCFGFTIKPVQSGYGSITSNEVVIRGRIVDEQTGKPIYGAIAIETRSTNGTLTDKKGEFRLKTQKDKTMKFVMVDYGTLYVQVNELGDQYTEIKLRKNE